MLQEVLRRQKDLANLLEQVLIRQTALEREVRAWHAREAQETPQDQSGRNGAEDPAQSGQQQPWQEQPLRAQPWREEPRQEQPWHEQPWQEQPQQEHPGQERPWQEQPWWERPWQEQPWWERPRQ